MLRKRQYPCREAGLLRRTESVSRLCLSFGIWRGATNRATTRNVTSPEIATILNIAMVASI